MKAEFWTKSLKNTNYSTVNACWLAIFLNFQLQWLLSNPTSFQREPHMASAVSVRDMHTVYTYTVHCVRGGGGHGGLGFRQINTCRKVPLHVIFLHDDILHCLLWVLSLYVLPPSNNSRLNCKRIFGGNFSVTHFRGDWGRGGGRASIFDSFHRLNLPNCVCWLIDFFLPGIAPIKCTVCI